MQKALMPPKTLSTSDPLKASQAPTPDTGQHVYDEHISGQAMPPRALGETDRQSATEFSGVPVREQQRGQVRRRTNTSQKMPWRRCCRKDSSQRS